MKGFVILGSKLPNVRHKKPTLPEFLLDEVFHKYILNFFVVDNYAFNISINFPYQFKCCLITKNLLLLNF
jgi:hypothetical protein